MWVSVSLIGKVSNGCIKDLEFNLTAYIKNWLMSWSDNKEPLSEADAIGWNSFSKKKKCDHAFDTNVILHLPLNLI